jgi:hypothetical protein
MKPYQYGKIKVGATRQRAAIPQAEKPPEEREPVGLIQGQTPQSRNEWYVAQALEEFKLPYMYQLIVRGGGGRRGTIILDFLVFTPFSVPVQVYGEYWHSGQRKDEDRLQEAYIEQYFGREVVPIWGSESESREAARTAVQSKLL